ncbi:MAG: hypothetical protein ACRETX_12920, partial [Steroidobacteraceae bacterium]
MEILCSLSRLTDDELEARLRGLVCKSNELSAELITHLAELDRRKLYARWACPSLHAYCTSRLGLSDSAASKRIAAARQAAKFPVIVERIRSGKNQLSAVVALSGYLTDQNHEELLTAAEGISQRELEKLIRLRFPLPDVPDAIRKLPVRAPRADKLTVLGPTVAVREMIRSDEPLFSTPEDTGAARVTNGTAGIRAEDAGAARVSDGTAGNVPDDARANSGLVNSSNIRSRAMQNVSSPPARREAVARTSLDRASQAMRYKIQFTADQSLFDKIERARALLSHQLPRGELAVLFDKALDRLIAELLQKRFGARGRKRSVTSDETPRAERERDAESETPRAERERDAESETPRAKLEPGQGHTKKRRGGSKTRNSRYVATAIRRVVAERDDKRCAFVDADGERCPARRFLEFQHHEAHARGGQPSVENLSLFC